MPEAAYKRLRDPKAIEQFHPTKQQSEKLLSVQMEGNRRFHDLDATDKMLAVLTPGQRLQVSAMSRWGRWRRKPLP